MAEDELSDNGDGQKFRLFTRRFGPKAWNWGNLFVQLTAIFLTVSISISATGIAIIFGVFSILSWIQARNSVDQARLANHLTFVSFCSSNNVSTTPDTRL